MFEAAVELGVLDGDADVAGEGLEELHVFGGEEVSVAGAAEAEDGDGGAAGAFVAGGAAGDVVVEVEGGGGEALVLGKAKDGLGGFEEEVADGVAAVEVEEAELEGVGVGEDLLGEAVGGGEREAAAEG